MNITGNLCRMTEETLGEYCQTIWIFGEPHDMWIPMMNPEYLTENNLWDNDRTTDTKQKNQGA